MIGGWKGRGRRVATGKSDAMQRIIDAAESNMAAPTDSGRDVLDVVKLAAEHIRPPAPRRDGAAHKPTAYEVAVEIKRLRSQGQTPMRRVFAPTNEEVGQAAFVLSVFEQLKEKQNGSD